MCSYIVVSDHLYNFLYTLFGLHCTKIEPFMKNVMWLVKIKLGLNDLVHQFCQHLFRLSCYNLLITKRRIGLGSNSSIRHPLIAIPPFINKVHLFYMWISHVNAHCQRELAKIFLNNNSSSWWIIHNEDRAHKLKSWTISIQYVIIKENQMYVCICN